VYQSDFLVVSGDLVTDARIDLLANIHRLHDASLVALFAPPALPNAAQIAAAEAAAVEKATAQSKLSDAELKKQKKKAAEDAKKPDLESIHSYYVGFDPAEAIPLPLEAASDPSTGHAHRLLYFSAAADVEESFTIRKAMLRRHPCMRVNTRLRDAHVYLFRHWILDLLDAVPLIESIQGDLIPYLLSKQFSSKAAPVNVDIEPQHSDAYARSSAPLPEPSLHKDHDSIRCYAYIAPAWAVVERVNTLPQLRLVNRAMAAHEYTSLSHLLQTRSQFNEVLAASPNATVGRECLIGEGSEFGERATLKNCVVGKHCRIKAQARLTNCILMDYAYVEERVTLNNCIIGRNAKVLAQCTLTDCSVGADFEVPACTNQKDGTLANDAIEDDE
jgi:NDP-sugar pyrophosphorylase family protein